jgi:signal transduction histidine kinase
VHTLSPASIAAGRLVAEVAHDVVNLLMTVTSNCSIMMRSLADENPARRCLEGIERTANQASLLARRLLLKGIGTVTATPQSEPNHRGASETWLGNSLEDLLTLIQGYCEVLLKTLPEGDAQHTDAEQIAKATQRAHALTCLLPAVAKREAAQEQVLDLNALVTDMAGIVHRLLGEGIELVTELAPDLPRIYGDRAQIERIILNLTTNARAAMRGGGKLTIQTTAAECLLSSGEPGRCAMLSISDTGCGIDDITLSRVFLPHLPKKGSGSGTGLGLSIVREVVEQSNGHMQVHSAPGQGTTFEIAWPRC